MGRKEHLQEGLHEIKRKKRVEVKADKKKNPRLKTKRKMRRSTKIATLCLVVSLVACAYSVGLAFFRDPSRNLVNLDYGSVSSAVESGETYSPDRGYSPVDIFARLNWTFSRQKRWYGEMHGTVDTVIQQEIETYKQYDNGILISADLTKSSLVSGASQFCYLKDEDLVMWRKPVGNASTYRGLETEWQTGEPYRIMTINGEDGFKAKNGLPAYELSVYVIEENTILEASDVNMTEDGLYKISYSLKPETWQEEENGVLVTKGATAYYANQMIFTGGLPEAPVFESINVAFTFDKNWRVFKTEIAESYSAKYGPIAAGCVSTSETKYEYDTERAVSRAYEDYFKQYLGASVDVNGGGTGEKEVTALNCLAEAFGSVLTGPVSLDLDLTLNGTPQKGVVNLDLGGLDLSAPDLTKVSAKARLGAIDLWVQDGKAYIDYGGMKFSLKIEELVSLFGDAIAPEEGESDLLGALAGGEFSVNGSEATLSSVLPIAGVEIPVKFFFKLDENKTAFLDHVETEIEIKEKLAVGAKLSFGEETLGEIANEEEYVDVLPYAQSLIGLFGSDVLHLDAEYSGDGVQVKGGFDLKVKDGFALFGKLDFGLEKDGISLAKTAELLYTDGEIFVTLDGIKVKADIEETLALLSGYFELPELSLPEAETLDLAKILNEVLSEEFASRFESTKSENLLVLLVEGTELLRAFGVEFDLGTVRLSVGDDALSVDALGAKISLTAGTEFDISTDGYVDILKYASTVIELIQSDVLHADVSYKTDKLSVAGTIDFDIEKVLAKANLTLTYGEISKEVELIYKENVIYITLDGLKLSAKVDEAIALVENFVEIPANDTDSKELINQLLSLKFGEVIKLSESDDTLTAAIDGTKLLEALGLTFDLGQATVKIGNDKIDLAVLGANVTLTKGKTFEANTDNFIDVVKYAETVIELIQSEVLHANVSYKTDELSVTGTIDFDVKNVIAKANLTLTYGEISKKIELVYKDNIIYITLDGLRLSAKVDEAIALIENFVEIPEGDTDSKELINQLLSLKFGEVIKLSESDDTLTAAIKGTELLKALGLKFDLGQATIKIGTDKIDLEVLGANVTLTKGTQFEVNTDDFIDVVKYAETIIELIQSEVLHADVSYKTDELSVAGKIDFDVKNVVAKAQLTLTYGEIEKAIELVYKDNIIYITLDGLKLSANVEEAIALVENFVEIPEGDTDSKELINQLLSLNFGEVIKLSESNETLTAAIDGTKLLEALGLTFDLGQATIKIGTDKIDLAVLGANVTLTKGAEFEANTDDFIDIVKYAETVIELIQSEVLHANVSYKTDELSVTGTIDFDVKNVIAKANLTLTYGEISKKIELVYKDNIIYITLDGLKLSANVEEAIALVENFVEIPASDTDSKELINQLLSLNFGEIIKLSEADDTLTAAIDGTKLLEALGLTFELGEATVKIGASDISLEVLGAKISLTAGTEFDISTDGYVDILKYASTVIELIQSEVLHADVSYSTDNLKIAGTIDVDVKDVKDVKNVVAKANLTLKYEGISKSIELIYKDNVIYITLDGLKLSAKVEEAIALVENFVEISENDTDSKELINNLLSLNFGEVIKLSESDDTLTVAIDGTKLLEALGLTFDLGEAQVKIGTSDISLEVLGANVTLTKGAEFEANTDDFIDVVKYASTVIELIQSEVLHADVSYNTDNLEIVGTIDFDIEQVLAKANLTLTYGEIEKSIELIYKDSVIYITLDGLKLSAKVDEAIALVENFVEISENDTDSKELINNLLSLNFGEVIKLSESNDTLTAAIDGTKLLEALGLTFDLGQATVKIGNDKIDLEVLGAEVTLTSGKSFEANTDNFIDVVKYASTVIELIQSDVLHADVAYKTEKLEISGTIDFDVKNVIAKANLTLTYNGIEKSIELIYKDSTIYITLDGLKLSAKVDEAIALVENFVEIPEGDTDSKELINKLLNLNFGEFITLSESNDTLTAAIDGTKLLEALGLKFELGDATIKIGASDISLEVLGANVTLTKGTEFEANTDDFIDILKYASTVIELIQSEVLHANVAYKTEKLAIEGKIDFDVEQVLAKAQLTLTYGEIEKSIELIYKDSVIYITLDGLKLSAKVDEAIALVENFVEIPANDTDSKELINNLLSLNFGEVIKLSEENNTLTAAIDGTKLLEALGLTFELGNATVKIGNDQIDLAVLGANVTLTKGEKFEISTDGFIDLAPVLEKIGKIVQNGGLELRGILTLVTQNGEIVLEICRAAISWKDGFKLYLDATLSLAGTAHDVKLYADKTMAKIVYGDVGAEIVYKEVKGLEAKFLQVYDRIADIVNGSFKTESGAPLPTEETMKELLTSLFGNVEDTTRPLGNESMQQLFNALQSSGSFLGAFDSVKESSFASSDLSEILGSLVLSSVLNEGTATGCITAEYKGLKLGVSTAFAKLDESLPAMVQANISYAGEGISLRESTVYLCELTSFPEMPNITYLCYEDYCELLDFFGAAITTLAEKNVGLNLSGTVLSTDEKYSAVGGEKYTFDASVRFYSGTGEGFPITIDTATKSISVRSDMYLKVHLTLSSKVETGLWLDLIVMDMDSNGKTDGKLDFFVSISKYEEGNASRSPLSFYAPASEVKTLLSAACILLGVDNSILNDYLIEKGLSIDTRSQLQSIGDSLQLASLISGLVGKNDEPAEFAEILEGTNREENLKRNYLSKFSFAPTRNENGAINGNTLTLALNGKAIYNDANADDIELVLEKQGESFVSSRLIKVALSGVTSGNESFSFKLGFSYDEIKEEEKTNIKVTHNFDGVERLITSIAKSATHTATQGEIISGEAKEHDYVLNKTFYIDGKAKLSIPVSFIWFKFDIVEVEVKLIAISVTIDEENNVAVNLRLEYDGLHMIVDLINGHSIVDITIKDGMVYMKRVQTSETKATHDEKFSESEYITIYRVTTLSNFFDDFLKHLGFLLNFGDLIVSAIEGAEPAAPQDTTSTDYGALVSKYLSSYVYTHKNGEGDTWTINLNGNALTDGVLSDIGITFTADSEDVVRDLHVSTKLYEGNLFKGISLTLDLNWRNPQSADDYADNQTDRKFADQLADEENGIGAGLKIHDFTQESFIEFVEGTINYSYHKYQNSATENLGSAHIYYKTNDRKVLNEPKAPDLKPYDDGKEFYLEWDAGFCHVGDVLPENAQNTASQKPHLYDVTFICDEAQAGTHLSGYSWAQNGARKSFTVKMKYNSQVKFSANGKEESRKILGNTTIELPDAKKFHDGAEGEWNLDSFTIEEAKFTAFYPLTVRYYSEIAYKDAGSSHAAKQDYDVRVEDSNYKLITPTAEGYTFLGWYTKDGSNWREAKEISSATADGKMTLEVQALWMKNDWITFSHSKVDRGFLSGADYSAALTVNGFGLKGAFASESGISTEYNYYLSFDGSSETPSNYEQTKSSQNAMNFDMSKRKLWGSYSYAHGKIEVIVTTKSGFSYTYEKEYDKSF